MGRVFACTQLTLGSILASYGPPNTARSADPGLISAHPQVWPKKPKIEKKKFYIKEKILHLILENEMGDYEANNFFPEGAGIVA